MLGNTALLCHKTLLTTLCGTDGSALFVMCGFALAPSSWLQMRHEPGILMEGNDSGRISDLAVSEDSIDAVQENGEENWVK